VEIHGEQLASAWQKKATSLGRDPTLEEFIHVFINSVNSSYQNFRYLIHEAGIRERLFHHEIPRALDMHRALEEKRHSQWMSISKKIDDNLDRNGVHFLRNYRGALKKDDYGNVLDDRREEEITSFLRSIKVNYRSLPAEMQNNVKLRINKWYSSASKAFESNEVPPINGHDFEHWVAAKLIENDWNASVTQASGDDGVDVIATREGLSVAIQCKRFSGSVGTKAVQEIYSGMKHMQLDRAAVVSTGNYTKAAKGLAATTGVLLLGERDLPHLWRLIQG
jgi:predicted helicase